MTKGKGKGWFETPGPDGVAEEHRKAALKGKKSDLSNAEVKPANDENEEIYEELHYDYGIEKEDAKLIEAEVGSKITDISECENEKTCTFENEEEWLVFENENDAEEAAIKRVEETINENPEYVPKWNLTSNLNAEETEYLFREIYDESNIGYVDGIEDEDDDEYTNRLAREMYDYDIITYEEATDESFNLEDKKEEMIEKMTNDAISEGNYGYDYYESNFGEEQALELIKDRFLIDTRAAAEDIVNQYGIPNELARYDSIQVDLDNGMVMFRQD